MRRSVSTLLLSLLACAFPAGPADAQLEDILHSVEILGHYRW